MTRYRIVDAVRTRVGRFPRKLAGVSSKTTWARFEILNEL